MVSIFVVLFILNNVPRGTLFNINMYNIYDCTSISISIKGRYAEKALITIFKFIKEPNHMIFLFLQQEY